MYIRLYNFTFLNFQGKYMIKNILYIECILNTGLYTFTFCPGKEGTKVVSDVSSMDRGPRCDHQHSLECHSSVGLVGNILEHFNIN